MHFEFKDQAVSSLVPVKYIFMASEKGRMGQIQTKRDKKKPKPEQNEESSEISYIRGKKCPLKIKSSTLNLVQVQSSCCCL